MRGRPVGAVQRDDIGDGQQLVELDPARAQIGRDVGIDLAARLVDDVHAEGLGAACRRLADAAHAHDAQGLALQAGAEEEEHAPLPRLAGADDAFALAESASRHQEQAERDVGGRLGEHAWRVRRNDTAFAAAATSMLS